MAGGSVAWAALRRAAVACACGALVFVGAMPAPSAPLPSSAALDAFARAWAAVAAYTATVTVFERKSARVQNVVFDYSFRKPSNVTVHVVKGPNAGVTLIWNGGTGLIGHRGSGLMGVFKKSLSLHDPQVTTIRGSSIDELGFGKILAHARQTPGKLSLARGPVIGGVETDALTLIAAHPAANASLTREIIDISRTTHLPMRVVGYQGRTLVRKIDYSNVKLVRS